MNPGVREWYTGNIEETRRENQEKTAQRYMQHWRKQRGQSRIDNPETLATLDTQDTGRSQPKQTKKHNTEN